MQHLQPIQKDHEDPDWIMSLRSSPSDEPMPALPSFNGLSDNWDAFWIQFQLLSKRYRWKGSRLVEQLLLSLKGEAASFVTSLHPYARYDEFLLIQALKNRFCHDAPEETHRASLYHIKKNFDENLPEYAARIQQLMSKAYPDIMQSATYQQLLIQHFLKGIPDQQLAYEVLTRQPRTIYEAISLVDWHECCKDIVQQSDKLNEKSDREIYSQAEHTGKPVATRQNRLVTEEQLQQILLAPKTTSDTQLNEPDSNECKATQLLPGHTAEEIVRLQREDEDVGIIHHWFDQQSLPEEEEAHQLSPAVTKYWVDSDNVVRRGKLLYLKRPVAWKEFTYLLLIPKSLIHVVISSHHVKVSGDHCGANTTSKKIREKFHWYRMDDDIRRHIKSCGCNIRTQPVVKSKTTLPCRRDQQGLCNQPPRIVVLPPKQPRTKEM